MAIWKWNWSKGFQSPKTKFLVDQAFWCGGLTSILGSSSSPGTLQGEPQVEILVNTKHTKLNQTFPFWRFSFCFWAKSILVLGDDEPIISIISRSQQLTLLISLVKCFSSHCSKEHMQAWQSHQYSSSSNSYYRHHQCLNDK